MAEARTLGGSGLPVDIVLYDLAVMYGMVYYGIVWHSMVLYRFVWYCMVKAKILVGSGVSVGPK